MNIVELSKVFSGAGDDDEMMSVTIPRAFVRLIYALEPGNVFWVDSNGDEVYPSDGQAQIIELGLSGLSDGI